MRAWWAHFRVELRGELVVRVAVAETVDHAQRRDGPRTQLVLRRQETQAEGVVAVPECAINQGYDDTRVCDELCEPE